MKKIILGFVVMAALTACSNTKIDESESTGVTPGTAGVEKLETLSNADTTQAKSDSTYCNCDHKCKTKEECEKHCGEKCEMMKK